MKGASSQILDLIECLGRMMQAELRHRAGGHQLQTVHVQALMYLRVANRYSNTPQSLAEYLGSTKGTVSQSLLLLYRRGLIERYADDKDRRVVRLRLSAHGAQVLDTVRQALDWQRALSTLEPAATEHATEVLGQLLLALQRETGGKSFGICHTCNHFLQTAAQSYRCGLTGEPLTPSDIVKICREHTLAPRTP